MQENGLLQKAADRSAKEFGKKRGRKEICEENGGESRPCATIHGFIIRLGFERPIKKLKTKNDEIVNKSILCSGEIQGDFKQVAI